MTSLGAWLTITIIVTVGLLLGVVLSWIDQPGWATPGRLAVILLLVAAADIGLTYAQQSAPVAVGSSDQDATVAASQAGLEPTRVIDPHQVSRTVLSITGENSGDPHLVEGRLDDSALSTVAPGPLGGPFAVTRGHKLVVAAIADGKSHASGLGIESLSGKLLRVLTSPHANAADTDPAVAANGEIVFLRTIDVWTGRTGTPVRIEVMKVPLSGTSPPSRIQTTVPLSFGSISVNSAGTLLAALCQPPDSRGATEACIFTIPSGHLRYVTQFNTSSPVTDVALSPNGQYLAYGDAADNAYGSIQIYVEDLATRSSVMVSHLPGNSQEPSWLPSAAAPCLLYSNSQTSGDTVYLSCLSAHPGTARVASGDYPQWLGTTMRTVRSSDEINWRALWAKTRSTIMLIGVFLLGLLLGLLGGWFPRPAWATRGRIIVTIFALGAIQIAGAIVIPGVLARPSGGLTTVAQLDPGQAGDLLVEENNTTGTGQLFGVRLNGTNTESLQFYPSGSPFIPVGTAARRFILDYGSTTDASIMLVGASGNEIEDLSHPPPGKTDSSPALAAQSGQVYFMRSTVVPDGPSATTTIHPVVLRTTVAGGIIRRVPLNPPPVAGPISVNATGTELAAACPHGHYVQACVYDLPERKVRYVASTPVGVASLALSPDGRYLAYGSSTTLYVYDFQTRQTFTISRLPGWNAQPNWLQGGSHPCLLYDNLQTAGDTIYLVCLTPQLAWAPVTQGEYPEWLGP